MHFIVMIAVTSDLTTGKNTYQTLPVLATARSLSLALTGQYQCLQGMP